MKRWTQTEDPLVHPDFADAGITTRVANKGGRNGAYGPYYLQADVRAGWRLRTAKNTLEFLVDVYNITNRTNFQNPVNGAAGADRRLTATFLVSTVLRAGSGFPRQAQLGVRYTF